MWPTIHWLLLHRTFYVLILTKEHNLLVAFAFRDCSLFKCQRGGRLKSRGGGHVNFHVASRGVAINFDFPAGGGGVMFKMFQ